MAANGNGIQVQTIDMLRLTTLARATAEISAETGKPATEARKIAAYNMGITLPQPGSP